LQRTENVLPLSNSANMAGSTQLPTVSKVIPSVTSEGHRSPVLYLPALPGYPRFAGHRSKPTTSSTK